MPMGKGTHPAYRDSDSDSDNVKSILRRGIKKADREFDSAMFDGKSTVDKIGLASSRAKMAESADVNAEAAMNIESRNRKAKK